MVVSGARNSWINEPVRFRCLEALLRSACESLHCLGMLSRMLERFAAALSCHGSGCSVRVIVARKETLAFDLGYCEG